MAFKGDYYLINYNIEERDIGILTGRLKQVRNTLNSIKLECI
jgi:hypothetical protein